MIFTIIAMWVVTEQNTIVKLLTKQASHDGARIN